MCMHSSRTTDRVQTVRDWSCLFCIVCREDVYACLLAADTQGCLPVRGVAWWFCEKANLCYVGIHYCGECRLRQVHCGYTCAMQAPPSLDPSAAHFELTCQLELEAPRIEARFVALAATRSGSGTWFDSICIKCKGIGAFACARH